MITVLPGHERTEEQFTQLFAQAGLRLAAIVEVPAMAVSIIEAVATSR